MFSWSDCVYLRDAHPAPKKLHCSITTSTPASSNADLTLDVDSGSGVCLALCSTLCNLQPPTPQLVINTRKRITVFGCLHTEVSRGNVPSGEV